MDETNAQQTGDTKDGVAAATTGGLSPEALAAAAAAANEAPAPANALEQWLASVEKRVAMLESFAGKIAPTVADLANAAAPAVEAVLPSAAPYLARLPQIEAVVSQILASLGAHFGSGKIPGLPTAIPAATTPASSV